LSLSTHEAKIAHLLRRTGFTVTKQQVDALLSLQINEIVDKLLQTKHTSPYPPLNLLDTERYKLPEWWIQQMIHTTNPLLEKMTLFWHGHFTSALSECNVRSMANQNVTLRRLAMSNFRKLTYEISVDPAMLVWLDNQSNMKKAPNENYTRELMELFTLGIGNYTERDVREVARALTGWRIDMATLSVTFDKTIHDTGTKTFLGKTGTFGLKETVDILVEHPASARFLAKKLWEFFAYPNPESQIIDKLAKAFRDANYEIKPLLRALFTSDAFYSSKAEQCLVKSPTEFTVWVLSQFPPLPLPTNSWIVSMVAEMGQYLCNPPNVAGWPGGPAWLSSAMLFARFNFVDWAVAAAINSSQFPMPKATAPQDMLQELINKTGLFNLSTQTRNQIETFIKQSKAPRDKLATQLMQLLLLSPEAQMK
jgi:uncharacterized protein (DUF1800 family)